MQQHLPWWQTGVIYQVYPRSFADANADGVGDLRGITSKLDYLEWLGIDAIWLSPFYPSPMADFGYDVAEYCDVDPLFGKLSDFDELLEKAHRLGMRVILDFVLNHSSDKHPWFVESRSSKGNPKRDWYVWRDPRPDGSPPNNWIGNFGDGSAWEWDEATGQYYLHVFDVKQPDLNWRNPEVREAMYEVMRFWLDRGVDGFRLDALSFIAKDEKLRDDPPNPDWQIGDPPGKRQLRVYSDDRPEIIEIVREMRAVTDAYDGERLLIGELYLPLERLVDYYGTDLDGLHLPFNFGLVLLEEWNPESIGKLIERYEAMLPKGAGANWVLGNHDNPRIASRTGAANARIAQMLLLTLRGTSTFYYGDEIGMQDVYIPPEMVRDPQGVNDPAHSRDPARTPMQWNGSPNSGFALEDIEPWLPVSDQDTGNVAAQRADPTSMLSLFRRLIALRKELSPLAIGSYSSVATGNPSVQAYLREHGERRVLVALNFGSGCAAPDLSEAGELGEVLCSTYLDRTVRDLDLRALDLRANEGLVVSLEPYVNSESKEQ